VLAAGVDFVVGAPPAVARPVLVVGVGEVVRRDVVGGATADTGGLGGVVVGGVVAGTTAVRADAPNGT